MTGFPVDRLSRLIEEQAAAARKKRPAVKEATKSTRNKQGFPQSGVGQSGVEPFLRRCRMVLPPVSRQAEGRCAGTVSAKFGVKRDDGPKKGVFIRTSEAPVKAVANGKGRLLICCAI